MSKELFDLTGSVAVVIGGTGVLGGSLADALGAAGAKIAVAGRSQERGEARAEAIRSMGGTAAFFEADASSRASIAAMREAVTREWGVPDILINAAGGQRPEGNGNGGPQI